MHEAFPNAAIFVRTFDRRALLKLKGTPIAGAVREVLDSAVRMARQAMSAVGVDQDEINRTEDLYRARDRERLKIQYEAGDLRAAREQVIAPTGDWNVRGQRRADAGELPASKAGGTDCG